jgi:hypothetical protein
LGQIEDASFGFAGTRFAGTRLAGTTVAVSTVLDAVVEPDERTVECGVELIAGVMFGVVAQIQPGENINVR